MPTGDPKSRLDAQAAWQDLQAARARNTPEGKEKASKSAETRDVMNDHDGSP